MKDPNIPTGDPEALLVSRTSQMAHALRVAQVRYETTKIPGQFLITRGNKMVSIRADRGQGSAYTIRIQGLAAEEGDLTTRHANSAGDVLSLLQEIPVGEIQQTTTGQITEKEII